MVQEQQNITERSMVHCTYCCASTELYSGVCFWCIVSVKFGDQYCIDLLFDEVVLLLRSEEHMKYSCVMSKN